MVKGETKKTALVTGGNRGIGLATARALVGLDVRVFIGARNINEGRKAARDIGAEVVRLDLTDDDSLVEAVETIGSVDILINNAGVLPTGSLFDDPDDFKLALSVMVEGPYRLMQLITSDMVSNDYGRIVNVSSGWGAFSDGLEMAGHYGVAKAALNALTKVSAKSLPVSVKVNSACPGWVKTRMGGESATRSPAKGAETIVWLATLGDNGPTGKFFRDRVELDW